MKYAVLFKRGERTPNLDELYDQKDEAERRCEELQHMFDWLETQSGKPQEHRDVWVEERDLP
tara:strand:+ start:4852 stop:5037 length:186 start_codon:yes stop_codon:yes gene_type:complete